MDKKVHDLIGDMCPWLRSRTILLANTGSFAYGTNVEGSDRDYKGVCIPPESYLLGLDKFECHDTTGHNGVYKGVVEDIGIISLGKFVHDAMSGVPNNIEILFVEPDDILYKDECGFAEELLYHRKLFLSKAAKLKMCGYAYSQIQKMIHGVGSANRTEMIEKYGYDTKYFMHAVRLLESAEEILTTGDYHTRRPNRDELLKCRNGYFTQTQAIAIVTDLQNKLDEIYETTNVVPYVPDYDKINSWLVNMHKRAVTCATYDFSECKKLKPWKDR